MPGILMELTNCCNLRCRHCYVKRHSGDGNLKLEIIDKVLQSARAYGVDFFSFTGGEPTLHPEFSEIIARVVDAGYDFGFVTNGWNFLHIYQKLLHYAGKLKVITFSLDGATEKTHDRLRGSGAFRRLMKAVSICVVKDIPFTFNSVITADNFSELKDIADMAACLGSRGLRFGHCIPTLRTAGEKLDLSLEERRDAEAAIGQLQEEKQIPIILAPGVFTADLFPCAPLQMQEFNIDWQGNVTFCCHLSGYDNGAGHKNIIANLSEMTFSEAFKRLNGFIKRFHEEKIGRQAAGELADSDYFPCWYCLNYFKKVAWFKSFSQNRWTKRVGADASQIKG